MSQSPSSRPVGGTGTNGIAGGYLEFEKPLARIEQDILELESAHSETGRDLSTQIREMRVLRFDP